MKLLKAIQEEINNRTRALDDASGQSSRMTDEQQLEYTTLSQEQGKLADLVTNMIETSAERPEDSPDSLPDVREVPLPPPDPAAAQENSP